MRLKTEFWIQAYVRICANEGCPAFIVHHGDDDAGAPFVKVNHLDGTASLYGPAPAGFSESSEQHVFCAIFDAAETEESVIDDYIARQRAFDRDLWVVEVEDRQRRHFLDGWLKAG